jgi:hypothetical protein
LRDVYEAPGARSKVLDKFKRTFIFYIAISIASFGPDLGYDQLPRLLEIHIPDRDHATFLNRHKIIDSFDLEVPISVHQHLIFSIFCYLLIEKQSLEGEHIQ